MIKRKLKPWVFPTIYALVVAVVFTCLYILGNTINDGFQSPSKNNVKDVLIEEDIPVNKEIESTKILKPYNGENVTIANKFYEKDADEKTQQNSLIYYENIYMQNTGILYNSDKQFNVIAVLDGTVKNIKEDKILGNVIEIEHGTNLTAFYQSIDNIKVKVGDQVKQGDLIATSGANNIENTKDNCLHFQVYNQGQLLNPETFYTMNLNELS